MGLTGAIFVVFFGLVVIGVPIAIALSLGAMVPLLMYTNVPLMAIIQKFFTAVDVFSFMAIPLFILCGGLLEKSGVSKKLCDFAAACIGWLPGGIAIVTFVVCMFFGAISGSATATVIAIGSIMVPILIEQGYEEKFALAAIAAGGILGVIIPPSIPMVVYGMGANVSISDVFMGGIIPGIILTTAFSIYSFIYGRKHVTVRTEFELKKVFITFKDALWGLMMPVIILGGIYGGIFTPTEAAAAASVYGMIVGFFIYRNLNMKEFYRVLKDSVTSSAMIMFIVAAASAYCYVMTREQIPLKIAEAITSVSTSPIIFLMLVNVLLLIIGTFMETCAALLIVTPMFVPVCQQMGIDMVAFGVIMVINLAIGMITPPLGLNLFVAARLRKKSVDFVVNKHLIIFIGIAIGCLLLFTYCPGIITFLPNLLKG